MSSHGAEVCSIHTLLQKINNMSRQMKMTPFLIKYSHTSQKQRVMSGCLKMYTMRKVRDNYTAEIIILIVMTIMFITN